MLPNAPTMVEVVASHGQGFGSVAAQCGVPPCVTCEQQVGEVRVRELRLNLDGIKPCRVLLNKRPSIPITRVTRCEVAIKRIRLDAQQLEEIPR